MCSLTLSKTPASALTFVIPPLAIPISPVIFCNSTIVGFLMSCSAFSAVTENGCPSARKPESLGRAIVIFVPSTERAEKPNEPILAENGLKTAIAAIATTDPRPPIRIALRRNRTRAERRRARAKARCRSGGATIAMSRARREAPSAGSAPPTPVVITPL